MDLQEAFRKSIKKYFQGKQPKATKALGKRIKYDKKYFDKFEKDKFGSVPGEENDE